jgi:hypothetical protein
VASAPTSTYPVFILLAALLSISVAAYLSTKSISQFFVTSWTSHLLALPSPAWKSSCRSYLTSSWFKDAVAVLREVPLFPLCRVAANLQSTVAHALGFSVSTSLPAMDLDAQTLNLTLQIFHVNLPVTEAVFSTHAYNSLRTRTKLADLYSTRTAHTLLELHCLQSLL